MISAILENINSEYDFDMVFQILEDSVFDTCLHGGKDAYNMISEYVNMMDLNKISISFEQQVSELLNDSLNSYSQIYLPFFESEKLFEAKEKLSLKEKLNLATLKGIDKVAHMLPKAAAGGIAGGIAGGLPAAIAGSIGAVSAKPAYNALKKIRSGWSEFINNPGNKYASQPKTLKNKFKNAVRNGLSKVVKYPIHVGSKMVAKLYDKKYNMYNDKSTGLKNMIHNTNNKVKKIFLKGKLNQNKKIIAKTRLSRIKYSNLANKYKH